MAKQKLIDYIGPALVTLHIRIDVAPTTVLETVRLLGIDIDISAYMSEFSTCPKNDNLLYERR